MLDVDDDILLFGCSMDSLPSFIVTGHIKCSNWSGKTPNYKKYVHMIP